MEYSVIIPFYREYEHIEECVGSVVESFITLRATYEVIVIDDSPNDLRLLEDKIGKFHQVKLLKTTGGCGAGIARNIGIEASGGSYLCFLDADDTWLPEKMSNQAKLLVEGFNFIATGYKQNSFNVLPIKKICSGEDFLCKLGIGTSTVVVSKSLVGKTRFTDRTKSQDTIFWFELFNKPSVRYIGLQRVLAFYFPSERTSDKFSAVLDYWQLLNEFGFHGLKRAGIFIVYLFQSFKRYFCFWHRRRNNEEDGGY